MTRNLSDPSPVSAAAREGTHRRPPLLVIPDYQGHSRPAAELAAAPRQEPRAPQPSAPSSADLTLPTLPVQDSLASDCTPTRPVERMFAGAGLFNVPSLDTSESTAPDKSVDEPQTMPTAPEHGAAASSLAARGRRTVESWFQRTGHGMARLAAATDPMRRLMQQIPQRSHFGWQRTILLIVGGAVLAFGITGGGRRQAGKTSLDTGAGGSRTGAEIQRMTRAPLRVDRPTAPVSAPQKSQPQIASTEPRAGETGEEDPIFRMPVMGNGQAPPLQEAVDSPLAPAARQPANASSEPANEFPKMAAPDGSAVTRRSGPSHPSTRLDYPNGTPSPPFVGARESLSESYASASGPNYSVASEPVAEAQGPIYPHTDPATYRDPIYEVPIIANRDQDHAR